MEQKVRDDCMGYLLIKSKIFMNGVCRPNTVYLCLLMMGAVSSTFYKTKIDCSRVIQNHPDNQLPFWGNIDSILRMSTCGFVWRCPLSAVGLIVCGSLIKMFYHFILCTGDKKDIIRQIGFLNLIPFCPRALPTCITTCISSASTEFKKAPYKRGFFFGVKWHPIMYEDTAWFPTISKYFRWCSTLESYNF